MDDMQAKILIIDDDKKLNQRLKRYLKKFNYEAITATRPSEGLEKLEKKNPDLIILDIMLPERDGFEVIKEIREDKDIPVIMLSARGEVTDRVLGLELGSDDYIPKPFEPRELVARIQTVFRRKSSNNISNKDQDIEKFKDLKVDYGTRKAFLNGKEIDLTHKEFQLLKILIKNKGKALDRDFLMNELKGADWEVYDRSIDVLLSRLRQKLNDDPNEPEYIETVWGYGYMFIGEN